MSCCSSAASISTLTSNADNIDYDDIKYAIKAQTTAGKGKSVAVPGMPDEKLRKFEDELCQTLSSQHERIGLFVKSKSGEIRRRLEHSHRQLQQLSVRPCATADSRIPASRLERYGMLEHDVIKAGDEIRALARFIGTQRTAFRKLLKKYKKWTGSAELEDRVRGEVLADPKSFANLDLGPLLDEYSVTLGRIRALYEERARPPSASMGSESARQSGSSIIAQLHASTESGSNLDFDAAVATIPLGDNGAFASYFIHPENLVELQILLLQHLKFHSARSRSNSIKSPVSPPAPDTVGDWASSQHADYFAIEADDVERFAREQNRVTVVEREHQAGSSLQQAKLCVRWNPDEDAHLAFRPVRSQHRYARIKRKYATLFLNRAAVLSPQKAAASPEHAKTVAYIRQELERDPSVRPLHSISSSRTRFVGNDNNEKRIVLATLDSGPVIRAIRDDGTLGEKTNFPFALLLVRQEGLRDGPLLAALDQSYLVERVRGFSLEYHATWQTQRDHDISPPFWLPILDRDIRKLPPPAIKPSSHSPSNSSTRTPNSAGSVHAESVTAVETGRSDSIAQSSDLGVPPLRSYRKKRRRAYPPLSPPLERRQQRYWSEYDNPEDGFANGDEVYVIYVDPNAKSRFDRFFDHLGSIFSRRDAERERLLDGHDDESSSSSADEASLATARRSSKHQYGTMTSPRHLESSAPECQDREFRYMPRASNLCFAASLSILVVAFVLAGTGRRKLAPEVDFGVLFAVVCSLVFAVLGFVSMLRSHELGWVARAAGVLVLVVDAVGSGGVLAWILG